MRSFRFGERSRKERVISEQAEPTSELIGEARNISSVATTGSDLSDPAALGARPASRRSATLRAAAEFGVMRLPIRPSGECARADVPMLARVRKRIARATARMGEHH